MINNVHKSTIGIIHNNQRFLALRNVTIMCNNMNGLQIPTQTIRFQLLGEKLQPGHVGKLLNVCYRYF